jgi:hypothetical protein
MGKSLYLLAGLLLAGPAVAGICVLPSWPDSARLVPTAGGYALSIGPRVVGISAPGTAVREGNTINVTGAGFDYCGIGVPPPPQFLVADVGPLPDGVYTVNVRVNFVPYGVLTDQFQVVAGTPPVQAIDATSRIGLLVLVTALLAAAAFMNRARRTVG